MMITILLICLIAGSKSLFNQAALAWVRRDRPAKWIMKPRRSAGSDGVFLCTSEAEAVRAFHEICGRRTIFGEENRDVLMQEYLAGTEVCIYIFK